MKFVYLFPVLGIAAALGAMHALPGSSSHALAQTSPGPAAHVVPPWLVESAVDDPHAGLASGSHDPPEAVCPEIEAVSDEAALDPYQRVGLEPAPAVRVAGLEPSTAPNGRAIAAVHAARRELAGKALRVRGTVVKRNAGILGKTYLHLQDGSGSAEHGDDDLTVTTSESFELGETVEIEGELAIDQDIGAGYFYSALLTNAARVAP